MAGLIIGAQGPQRSGKTLLMYLIANKISLQYNIKVYSNIITKDENWIFINNLSEFPFNFEPKILFIDEVYNGADAMNYKDLSSISIFINTLGKQNVLFLFTTIDFEMVYNRIRNQLFYAIFVKSDSENIYYRTLDVNSLIQSDFTIRKCPELFKDVNYDTNYVPIDFNWSMEQFQTKLINYYQDEYPQLVKYITENKQISANKRDRR